MVAQSVTRVQSDPERLDPPDTQGLMVSSYKDMTCAAYLLFRVSDPRAARAWLSRLADHVTTAEGPQPVRSLNVALTYEGLVSLGLSVDTLRTFPHAFRDGMASARRSRKLGDTQESAPANWDWGSKVNEVHVLLLLYGVNEEALEELVGRQRAKAEAAGLRLVQSLEAGRQPDSKEHFGFADGVGQPVIEGSGNYARQFQRTNHATELKAGEFMLGYHNEYGVPAPGPTVNPADDPGRRLPPAARVDEEVRHDLGRNGSYLVFRQMAQHVAEFWRFLDEATKGPDGKSDPTARDRLGAKCVGRWRSGAPLVKHPDCDPHDGAVTAQPENDFEFARDDPVGFACPIGAHIRRANPRDSLGPNPETALKSARRHRLLRRGRSYGDRLADVFVEDGIPRGLHFICLNADIERQFEFVQQTWIDNGVFGGLFRESDPLMGNQEPTDRLFTIQRDPVRARVHGLRRFVTVKGGAYFFLPGLRALRYLATAKTDLPAIDEVVTRSEPSRQSDTATQSL